MLKAAGVSDFMAREIVGHESTAVSRQYTYHAERRPVLGRARRGHRRPSVAGIHFRTADEQGARLGKKVAHYLKKHYFQPVQGGRPISRTQGIANR